MPARKRPRSPRPRPAEPRATTVERAERALERTSTSEPTHTDDPARDKAEQVGSVIEPLPHSD